MRWKPARRRDLPALEPFLTAGEWKSVALGAYFCREGDWKLPPRAAAAVYFCTRGAAGRGPVAGVVLRTASGLLLPLLGEGDLDGCPAPEEAVRGIYSLMGMSRDVRWLERRLARVPETAVDYHLMTLRRENYAPRAGDGREPAGLTLRPAGMADLPALFPLQKNYELEEVVLQPDHFREQACRAHLKLSLKTQLVFLAEISGQVVAKAGTNARGRHCDQVGGVYTADSCRNRGIGFALMRVLLERIFREKSTATLFVKKTNLPAAALYRRLGFEIAGGYRISYFRS